MACEYYKASAPGSFMISGEHAVLHGKLALVGAVDKTITVQLIPRKDSQIIIYSDQLGQFVTDLKSITVQPPLEYVLATVEYMHSQLTSGFEIYIDSQLSHLVGLSSSAAVTVATLATVVEFCQLNYSRVDYFKAAKSIIQKVQGNGSGADIAAAVYGGVLAFTADPVSIVSIVTKHVPWSLIYTGYKTPTPQVIRLIDQAKSQYPEYYSSLFTAIDTASQMIKKGLIAQDYQLVGEWFNRHAAIQSAMLLACDKIQEILYQCYQSSKVYGAKISGSGLGDCVLALGDLTDLCFTHQIPITIHSKGLVIHE